MQGTNIDTNLGLGAVPPLLRAGIEVVGCDVNSGSRGRFESSGAAFSSAAQAAQGVGATGVMVVDAAQTDKVPFGADGVRTGLTGDADITSSATMFPGDGCRRQKKLSKQVGTILMLGSAAGQSRLHRAESTPSRQGIGTFR